MKQAQRNYYYLLTREHDGRWSVQFGDYKKEFVEAERTDQYLWRYRHDELRYPSKDIKIVRGLPTQAWIKQYLLELNSKELAS
jgi:hypothetical protein